MENNTKNYWEHKSNGMVFLSYSSKDYTDVKLVKDYLEKRNMSSLMFYQKCLDEMPKDYSEQNNVLNEINSSHAFVFCKSINAKRSAWVQTELNYLNNLEEHKFLEEIDIDNMKYMRYEELSKLDKLIDISSMYFIYEDEDKEKVEQTDRYLSSNGFKILKGTKTQKENMIDSIQSIKQNSFIIVFLSANSMRKEWYKVYEDTFKNKCQRKNILFLSIDEFSRFDNQNKIDEKDNWFDMSRKSDFTNEMLLENIKSRLVGTKE